MTVPYLNRIAPDILGMPLRDFLRARLRGTLPLKSFLPMRRAQNGRTHRRLLAVRCEAHKVGRLPTKSFPCVRRGGGEVSGCSVHARVDRDPHLRFGTARWYCSDLRYSVAEDRVEFRDREVSKQLARADPECPRQLRDRLKTRVVGTALDIADVVSVETREFRDRGLRLAAFSAKVSESVAEHFPASRRRVHVRGAWAAEALRCPGITGHRTRTANESSATNLAASCPSLQEERRWLERLSARL